jgi:hypothetical protein
MNVSPLILGALAHGLGKYFPISKKRRAICCPMGRGEIDQEEYARTVAGARKEAGPPEYGRACLELMDPARY